MTTPEYEVVKISRYRLKKGDLSGKDQSAVAALAALSFAVSELNTLLRFYLFVQHDFAGPNELDTINSHQRLVLLRVISAKLFEATELVMLRGRYNKSRSKLLKLTLGKYQKSFRWLEKHPGYGTAKGLRNKATNHCTLASAKKGLCAVPENTDFSFLLHGMEGNSYYGMGEAVMHHGFMEQISSPTNTAQFKTTTKEYDNWLHWNLATLRWLRRVHVALSAELLDPSQLERERALFLPSGSAAAPSERLTPFFVRLE